MPEWIAAQEEFLSVRRMQGIELGPLVDGARQRMRQVGMSDAQIALVERSGRTQPRITLAAPIGGVVTELMVREGMTVMAGATLFRINGLATVWANAEVPESQSGAAAPGREGAGQKPGRAGRDVRRHGAGHPAGSQPGDAHAEGAAGVGEPARPRWCRACSSRCSSSTCAAARSLLVPTEAVIQTGKRTVVMLAEENGRFRPVEVEIGIESGGQTEIKRGLQAGPARRGVVAVPDRLGGQPQGGRGAAELRAAPG